MAARTLGAALLRRRQRNRRRRDGWGPRWTAVRFAFGVVHGGHHCSIAAAVFSPSAADPVWVEEKRRAATRHPPCTRCTQHAPAECESRNPRSGRSLRALPPPPHPANRKILIRHGLGSRAIISVRVRVCGVSVRVCNGHDAAPAQVRRAVVDFPRPVRQDGPTLQCTAGSGGETVDAGRVWRSRVVRAAWLRVPTRTWRCWSPRRGGPPCPGRAAPPPRAP